MRIAHAALSFLLDDHSTWKVDWAWGCPLTVLTVIFHVINLGFISDKIIQIHDKIKDRRPNSGFAIVVGTTTLLATVLHGIEAGIWAAAFIVIGALPDFRSAMLYSLGAITTYGHRDLYLSERWRLLGPIEALNGWLLFGLTTAFLFWMIQEVSPRYRGGH